MLGSFLFNVDINDIEKGCEYPDEPFVDAMEAHGPACDYPTASTPRRVGRPFEKAVQSPIRMILNTQ